jgi:hypothetical protein
MQLSRLQVRQLQGNQTAPVTFVTPWLFLMSETPCVLLPISPFLDSPGRVLEKGWVGTSGYFRWVPFPDLGCRTRPPRRTFPGTFAVSVRLCVRAQLVGATLTREVESGPL